MIVSYKYRAYPNPVAETRLNVALDTCRWLYNKLLEECNEAQACGVPLKKKETQARIVTLKDENPALKEVYSKVLQMVNYTLWSNIAALSQTKQRGRKVGKLRFRSTFRYRTLNYNQSVRHVKLNQRLRHAMPSFRHDSTVACIPGNGIV